MNNDLYMQAYYLLATLELYYAILHLNSCELALEDLNKAISFGFKMDSQALDRMLQINMQYNLNRLEHNDGNMLRHLLRNNFLAAPKPLFNKEAFAVSLLNKALEGLCLTSEVEKEILSQSPPNI